MRTLLLRSLIAAVLIGPAIAVVNELASINGGVKHQPALSKGEIERMKDLPMRDAEAAFRARTVLLTRWEWFLDSVKYSYYWKHIAEISVAPSAGVFVACFWVGLVERRRIRQMPA